MGKIGRVIFSIIQHNLNKFERLSDLAREFLATCFMQDTVS
jgi:hypothetical protein